mgnify:CR=1 FL=1
MATIKDVAKKAGVSVCTVSRAIAGMGYIKQETSERIMAVVEELGYAPNKTAVSLKTGQTNLLALVVPSIRNVYYPKLARYVQNYANEKGYMMLLCSTDYKVEKEKEFLERLYSQNVSGVIVTTCSDENEHIKRLKTYGIPYVANAAGVLYNKDMFAEHGWEIPQTWDEFVSLCEEIQNEGIQPLYFGYKDTWTCLAPWNALAVGLAPSDVCQQVNKGETTFSKEYPQVAEKMLELLNYGEDGPFGYGYNDACTAFANGESAMYTIGSYAIPQIKSVNPDMNIGSFVFPANEDADKNVLNSGNDLMFCVMKDCKNKEAAYEVLSYMLEDENVKKYLNAQSAVPCKKGDFEITPELEEMRDYIENGIVADYQDHHYPSEMSVDAMIQTYLMDDSADATDTFMKRFDKEWIRYNRDVVAKVKAYEEGNDHE